MKKIAAAALAGLAMASTPTQAADLFGTAAPPMSEPSDNPMVEIGSNWYIRGDVGVGFENSATIASSTGLIPTLYRDIPGTGAIFDSAPPGNASNPVAIARGNNQNSTNAVYNIGLGYRVNDVLRLDATYSFWQGPGLGQSQNTRCPDTTTAVSNPAAGGGSGPPVGYLWAPVPCTGYLNAKQFNNLALANAYLDLGNHWGFTPYIGAGAGFNVNTISGSTSFFNNNDGSPFAGNTSVSAAAPLRWVTQTGVDGNGNPVYTPLTHQPGVVFGAQNWNRTFTSTKLSFAGALMVGFGYQLTRSATVDVGYRFVDADLSGATKNISQQLLIGVRYMAN